MATTDLVTILSTDWVASTATRVAVGEERADELQRLHDQTLRTCITTNGGTVVKGSGDGVLATFHSAADALSAAVLVQRRFAALRDRGGLPPIHLRVGLSAGDVVHQDGDIFGTPVIEAVRLQAAAESDQIVCAELVLLLARGRGGVRADPLGRLELKGLPEPVPVAAVLWARPDGEIARVPLPPELVPGWSPVPFIGRAGEIDAVAALAERCERSEAVWLLGEPGIGKTRLAGEIATRLHAAGHTVLFGRCDAEVSAPYAPLIDALRWFVRHTGDDHLADVVGHDPGPLARLVPELRERLPALRAGDAEEGLEQVRLFESVGQWVEAASRVAPVLLVLDDVHWADRQTLVLVRHLLRRPAPARLVLLATARHTRPDASDRLGELIDELDAQGRSRRVVLEGLTNEEISRFVTEAAQARRLTVETGGNPLYLVTLLATADPAAAPGDVRSALRRRLRGVDDETRHLLTVAAVVGLEFDLSVVARAAGLADDRALDLLEHAASTGLVHEVGLDRFRFAHALSRDALEEELTASRRARVHLAVARAFEERRAGDVEDHLRSLAFHYEQGATTDADLGRAAGFRYRAGRRALHLLAYDAAGDDFAAAIALRERSPNAGGPSRFECLMGLGAAQTLGGRFDEAYETFRRAADEARSRSDWRSFAAAAQHLEAAGFPTGRPGHPAVRLLDEALTHTDELDPAGVARVTAALARAHAFTGDHDRAREVAAAAADLARMLQDPPVLVEVMDAVAAALESGLPPAHLTTVVAIGEEVAALGDGVGDRALFGNLAQYVAVAAIHLGDRDLTARWVARVGDVGDSLKIWFARYLHASWCCTEALLDGDLASAEHHAHRGLAIGTELGAETDGPHGVQMFLIRREQDRLDELAPAVRLVLGTMGAAALWRPGAALLAAELGMDHAARSLIRDLRADAFAGVPHDALRLGALVLSAETAALLGDEIAARALVPLLEPWSGYSCSVAPNTANLGATDRYLAGLHRVLGRVDVADELLQHAVAFNTRLRTPLWLAHTLVDRATLPGGALPGGEARALLGQASELADRHHLPRVQRRILDAAASL